MKVYLKLWITYIYHTCTTYHIYTLYHIPHTPNTIKTIYIYTIHIHIYIYIYITIITNVDVPFLFCRSISAVNNTDFLYIYYTYVYILPTDEGKSRNEIRPWANRWNWSSCTKLTLSASWTHSLIAQSVRASERNSVVVGSNPTQASFL